MKSKVFFVSVKDADNTSQIIERFRTLSTKSGLLQEICAGEKGVVKIHFGEEGNTGFVRPEYVKVLIYILKGKGAEVVVSDTNTLYKGKRTNSKDHIALAYEHGFNVERVGAKVEIPENLKENNMDIAINGKYVKTAKVFKLFSEADFLLNVSHFKGHIMTGYGGALKNIGMGCAAREGKLEQHTDFSPSIVSGNCIGCGQCVAICPAGAIKIDDSKAILDRHKCIGCAECIAVCPTEAVSINWEEGAGNIQEKMVEYTKAILGSRKGKTIHFNFAIKITKECDCLAKDDPKIVSDIGIFASTDPVSVDKACLDAVIAVAGKDILKEVHPGRDGMKQLNYAHELGLGNLEYELIEV